MGIEYSSSSSTLLTCTHKAMKVRVSLSQLRKLSISPFICATTFRLISSDKISGKVANLSLSVPRSLGCSSSRGRSTKYIPVSVRFLPHFSYYYLCISNSQELELCIASGLILLAGWLAWRLRG